MMAAALFAGKTVWQPVHLRHVDMRCKLSHHCLSSLHCIMPAGEVRPLRPPLLHQGLLLWLAPRPALVLPADGCALVRSVPRKAPDASRIPRLAHDHCIKLCYLG